MATQTKTVRGIEMQSDFPTRRNSPDAEEAIEALVDTGTWVDAANILGCDESTLRRWRKKYPEIQQAYMKGREKIGYDAELTLVCIMKGTLPESADEELVSKIRPSDMINAAKKVVGINHVDKDYTQTNKIIRATEEADEDVQKAIEEMSEDELLDELNSRFGDE